MAPKIKSKLEVLWQDFEKSGSIEAYLAYQLVKAKPAKALKKEARVKSKR